MEYPIHTPELADILLRHWENYISRHMVTSQQKKVAKAIMACRTPVLDGFVEQCDHCHALRVHWHSCRDRHCPKCQYVRSLEWTEKRMGELLPVPYFHVVFTIPDVLHKICLSNQKATYNLLLKCVQDTLLTIAYYHQSVPPNGIKLYHPVAF